MFHTYDKIYGAQNQAKIGKTMEINYHRWPDFLMRMMVMMTIIMMMMVMMMMVMMMMMIRNPSPPLAACPGWAGCPECGALAAW